jgi:hypothetical protein
MIWQDKRDGGDLWRSLRRRGKRYNKRGGKNAGRGLIPDRTDISERPAIVARKARLGDWEGDTVCQCRTQRRLAHAGRAQNPTGQNHQVAARDRPRNTEGSRASPQADRRLRAHHHLRQRKGVRGASGHRLCQRRTDPCYSKTSLRFSSNSALSISPLAKRSFKISKAREAVSYTSGSSSRRALRRPQQHISMVKSSVRFPP